MSPLEVIEAQNPLENLIELRSSVVFEMVISLQTLVRPSKHMDWVVRLREAMGDDFFEEALALYQPFYEGCVLVELGIDCPNYDDVAGFLDYVAGMDDPTLIYYLLGRVFSLDEIKSVPLDSASIEAMALGHPKYEDFSCLQIEYGWVDDLPGLQQRLVGLWRWYWEGFFAQEVDSLRPHWEGSLHEKQMILQREGGQALYEHITGRAELPTQIPEGAPTEEIIMIPLHLFPRQVFTIFGYGNVTIFYNDQRTRRRIAEREEHMNALLGTLRSLGDETRLKILHQIAHDDGKLNGKSLARKLGISTSVVSRHLSQLREGGLIVEVPTDSRRINYSLQVDTIKALPDRLLELLLG
jgi:DNA-binding transcriptional ArsR family regulator